jgi:glyoxylate carboligase
MQALEVVVQMPKNEGIEAAFGIPDTAINPVYEHGAMSAALDTIREFD